VAYASYEDLVIRFGEVEIIRLASPDGQLDGEPDRDRVAFVLRDVSGEIDSIIGRRYEVPLNPVPPEIQAACCKLARFELAKGEGRTASEGMIQDAKDVRTWLDGVRAGTFVLDARDAITRASAFARTTDRPRLFEGNPGGIYP
jgi:phage gp36-like protein